MRPRREHRGGRGKAAVAARPVLASLFLLAMVSGPAVAAGEDGSAGPGSAQVFTVDLEVGGLHRTMLVVTPPALTLRPGRRPPLLMVLHGVGMRGIEMRDKGFEELAGRRGVVVAYPDGWKGSWNDGRPGLEPGSPGEVVDDMAFLRAAVVATGERAGADASRVAVVGFSNGAMMAGRLACDSPSGVVAVGLVAGTVGEGFATACRPPRALGVVQVAGTGDTTVPYGGGQVADFDGRRRGRVAAVDEFLAFWRGVDGCTSVTEAPVPGASVPVTSVAGGGCSQTGGVVHYRIAGGGHDWYRVAGFDTTAAVWGFVAPLLGTGVSPSRPWRAST